ncbi:MAG: NADH-quinone oxidoreductase subunit N [Bacteroidales bacterium]|nr:NADH-quinone oxidoreductase subunit N [Bacteroidales bacterium]HNW72331.1 NADH-quinone oxidoreductase subunit N [Bacteroidales bacterium]HPS49590.1 NADH-quinone oxidoreductase subunit N [Bacteroidales bacterium]
MLIMRHELLLVAITVILLIVEIFLPNTQKRKIILPAILLMAAVTIIGFLPGESGELFGGMYQSTQLSMLMKNILNIGVLIIFIQSVDWLKQDQNKEKVSEFFLLILSTLIGMNYMISAGDFLMFYLGLELATIPIAALAAYERYKEKSAEAGVKLIFISALSSGILLYGLSMIYGTTGTMYFSDIAPLMNGAPLQVLAFIFFFSGMAFKISLVPFHLWTADVYEGAPVNVTSYLSVISKGAAVFIFTIILYTVFAKIALLWSQVLYVIIILTITLGNLFAMRQQNLKRFLAFSSIAQAGFILLGIIGQSQTGMTTVIYFVLVYIFSNLGAFGVIGIISNRTGKEKISDYDGLYRTNPKLSLVMMLALFSLAGIPPLAGFFGKFFLFTAAAKQGYYILVLIAILNTIISLYYYLLVIKAMFLNTSDQPIGQFKSDGYSRLGLLLCVAGIVVVGFTSIIYEMIFNLSFGLF